MLLEAHFYHVFDMTYLQYSAEHKYDNQGSELEISKYLTSVWHIGRETKFAYTTTT